MHSAGTLLPSVWAEWTTDFSRGIFAALQQRQQNGDGAIIIVVLTMTFNSTNKNVTEVFGSLCFLNNIYLIQKSELFKIVTSCPVYN